MIARVYFATAEPCRVPRLRELARLMRRRPKIVYNWWLAWCVRKLSGSPLAHCVVAYEGGVLDPRQDGVVYWAEEDFRRLYPTLACVIDVPVLYTPNLDAYAHVGPRPAWPTVLRFLTGGRVKTDDCVQLIVKVLRTAGEPVPKRTTTPRQLHDWLIARGYAHEPVSGRTAANHRRASGCAGPGNPAGYADRRGPARHGTGSASAGVHCGPARPCGPAAARSGQKEVTSNVIR